MFWPPSHLAPFTLLVAGTAFLPLADLPSMACLVVASVHHLLLPAYMFHEQYASYTFGPLLFASACGLAALAGRQIMAPERRAWLLPPIFLTAAVSLYAAPRTVRVEPGDSLPSEAPALISQIPDKASAWADRMAAVRLATHQQLKVFWFSRLPFRFDAMLFRPEYVLVQKITLLSLARTDQLRIVGFLAREGYVKVAASRTLVLLRDPQAPRDAPSPALSLPNQPDDAARVAPYLAMVLDSPEARETLASYPPDLRFAPKTVEEEVAFARVLGGRGLARLAVSHNRAALDMMPDSPEAHANLGNALSDLGDLAGAEKELRESLRLQPDMLMTTSYNLGNVLIRENKPAEAAALLERLAINGRADARALNSLGAAYLLSGRRAEARTAFEKALVMDPQLEEARENLKHL